MSFRSESTKRAHGGIRQRGCKLLSTSEAASRSSGMETTARRCACGAVAAPGCVPTENLPCLNTHTHTFGRLREGMSSVGTVHGRPEVRSISPEHGRSTLGFGRRHAFPAPMLAVGRCWNSRSDLPDHAGSRPDPPDRIGTYKFGFGGRRCRPTRSHERPSSRNFGGWSPAPAMDHPQQSQRGFAPPPPAQITTEQRCVTEHSELDPHPCAGSARSISPPNTNSLKVAFLKGVVF